MELGERVFEFTRHKIITLKYKVYLIIELIQANYFINQSIIIMEAEQVLRPTIFKNISHKNEEKRKVGRHQLQKYIYLLQPNKEDQLSKIITTFYQHYLRSSDINKKLVGVEAMFIILSAIQYKPTALDKYESTLITHILNCLRDSQAKIRETTFKKIYELIQLFQEDSMRFFNRIFEKLIGCINDTEQVVKTACEFVDKKLKDLFEKNCNRQEYNMQEFVNILKSKIKTLNLQVRRYLIKWIEIMLQQDLIVYLAQFLEDLLYMISDKQIENSVYECLNSFELAINQKFEDKSLQQEVSIGYINQIFTILIKVANSKCQSYTKLKVLEWLKLFFLFFRHQVENRVPKINQKFYFKKIVIQRFDEILQPILLLMSHEEQEVRQQSRNVNEILMESVKKVDKSEPINIIKIVPLLKQALSQKKASNTSQHAINWMKFMFQNYEGKIIPGMKEIVQKVMQKIYEGNAKNIHQIIEIMKSKEDYFQLMIEKILLFLHTKIGESEDKIEPMLKKFINADDIGILWTTICKYIDKYEHHSLFMYEMAASLNSIVVNEPKLLRVRKFLQEWNTENYNYEFYFTKMFRILKYNPSAVISLCLLSNQYELAYKIIKTLTGKYQITSKVLLGLCKLVSQLQSPAFVLLRMQIMEKKDYYLLQCLNSLLMILPQGKMFNMLRNRLDSSGIIPKSHKIVTLKPQQSPNPLNIEAQFQQYKSIYGIK